MTWPLVAGLVIAAVPVRLGRLRRGCRGARSETSNVSFDETTVLMFLYIGGFVLQMLGVALVVREIADDVRAARAIQQRADEGTSAPQGIAFQRPGVSGYIGGIAGQHMAQTAHNIDSFREFTAERSEGIRWRIVGVGLFVIGAVMALAASLVATL